MKKNLKAILAVALVFCLVLSLGAVAYAEEDAQPQGTLKRISGDEKADYTEIFVSDQGSDTTGDGSKTSPYASLSKAAEAANEAGTEAVYICVLSGLTLDRTARFTGKDVSILGLNDGLVLRRGEKFTPAKDEQRGDYNGALIELGTLGKKDQNSGSLTLENIVLDDAGRHEGEKYQPACTDGSESNLDRVQDAMIAVYDDSRVCLSAGTELRSFGGLSAVRLTGKAKLVLESGSAIRDAEAVEAPEELEAVLLEDEATCETFEGAKVDKRNVAPAAEASALAAPSRAAALPNAVGDGELGFSFVSDPEEIVALESGALNYTVNYTLSFSLTETAKTLIQGAYAVDPDINGTGTITIQLDPLLSNVSFGSLESQVFQLDGEPTLDSSTNTVTAPIRFQDSWGEHLEELTAPATFTCSGSILGLTMAQHYDEYITATGEVSLTIRTASTNPLNYSSQQQTARTHLLGPATAAVTYDPNGGEGGPGTVRVSAQDAYTLLTDPAPTHADADGKAVIFIGWTETPDTNLYAYNSDNPPETVESVPVQALSSTTVYAVYGYDEYGENGPDGIADITQSFVTLTYDDNGGEGGPGSETKLAASLTGGVNFDISETEPTREYYSFKGWSKEADASPEDNLWKHDAEHAARRDILIHEDTTLYAVWEQNPSYTLYYDANGGTNAPAAQTAVSKEVDGSYVCAMTITANQPSRSGYSFQGWATSRRGSAAFFAGDEVEIANGSVILYAVWSRGGSSSSTSTGGSSTGNGNTGNPKTGDAAHPALYGILAAAALFGTAATTALYLKKRRG